MSIVDEDIARVREASDIVHIVSQYLQLRKTGGRWFGLCPFHPEKSPSFAVNPQNGLYMCFGCRDGGDVIKFVQQIEHLDFVGAVEWLANKAGITLRYTEHNENEGRRQRTRLIDAMRAAVEWYHERLLKGPDAGAARSYLRSRGFDGEIVRKYQIGWAPDGWDHLARALKLSSDVMKDTGLGFVNSRGRLTDSFRNRVMFPIFDPQGDPVAFGGRALPGSTESKYKNSSESAIYAKSKVLYGLNWAKADVVAANEVIVCEGYTDVIGLAQAGIERAVATCGTALTEQHLRLLKKFAGRVVLAFDADEAGQGAAERYYAWEKELDLDVAVVDLPDGRDPADLARSDPDALAKAVKDAAPFLGFRVERALRAANVTTPEGRARGAEAALAVIREHPSEFVRDQYLMQVADVCRVDPDRLRAQFRANGRDRRTAASDDGGSGSESFEAARRAGPSHNGRRGGWDRSAPRDTAETEALRLAIHRPADMAAYLYEELFVDEVHLAVFQALMSATTLPEALAHDDPEVAELLTRLAVEETDADPADVIARLVEEAAGREIRRLDAAARTSDDPMEYAARGRELKLSLEDVRNRASGLEAVDRLLALLVTRGEGQR